TDFPGAAHPVPLGRGRRARRGRSRTGAASSERERRRPAHRALRREAAVEVFVSIDMEGVAGIAHIRQVMRGTDDYPAARQLMTREANAAVAGAFAGGATRVVVNDSHGDMTNLLPDELDPRAELT